MLQKWISSPYFQFALVAIVCLLFLHYTIPCNLIQDTPVDPYFYTGYIHNYRDLIERYGRTYYSCRLAFIYPARLLVWIFGSELGYLIFRNILLIGAMGAIWRICLHFYHSKRIATLTIWLLVLHPWFLRALFWDYVDGIAVIYVLIATSFLITSKEMHRLSYLLGGAFFTLAVNCNLFSGCIFLALLPSWILLHRERGPKMLLLEYGRFFFLGAGAVYLFFMGVSYLEFPKMNPFFDSATFNISKFLFRGGGDVWRHSIDTLMSLGNFYIFYPLFIFFISLFFWNYHRKTKKPFFQSSLAKSAIVYLFLILFIYSIFHFFFKVCVISNCYYFSYILPAILFIFIWFIGESVFSLDSKDQNRLFITATVVSCIIWLFAPYYIKGLSILSGTFFVALSVCLILFFFICLMMGYKKLQSYLLLSSIVLSPLVFNRSVEAEYPLIFTRSAQYEWDLYRGAIYFQKTISESLHPSQGKVGFWYPYKPSHRCLDLVQATFLWGYSRITSLDTRSTGMPTVDDAFRTGMVDYKYITLLGMTAEEIQEGYEALKKEGIQTKLILKNGYHSKNVNYEFLVLEKL